MILKIVVVFDSKCREFMPKFEHNIVFEENAIFCRKLKIIARIEPSTRSVFFLLQAMIKSYVQAFTIFGKFQTIVC
jgi:hypothetical protein